MAGSRRDGRRQHLDVGPLLPALRRSRRRALRGLVAARGDGRRHRTRPLRPARRLQLVPQPGAGRGHGADSRPAVRRSPLPRDRLGVVRARLRRVRLRVRHARQSAARSRGGTAPDQGPPGAPRTRARRRAPDPRRRRRREGDPPTRRAVRRRVEHVRSRGELRPQERGARRVVREGRARSRRGGAHRRDRSARGRWRRRVPRCGRDAHHRDDGSSRTTSTRWRACSWWRKPDPRAIRCRP